MKSEDDIRNCKTDGIPNEYLKNPKLADEAREKIQIRNLDKFISVKDAFRPIPDIGYESPITMMASQMETKIEADTMSVIQRYGIDVNKDELIKALNYDRQQYDKGYKDGYREARKTLFNAHQVACLLADMFKDTCACNYNDNDTWLPQVCEVIESCPDPIGVACWEQFVWHYFKKQKGGDDN